ncbi:helix-turn-helix transcriptional regulator [Clostridium sp. 19966]|uniref:AraC family transcriptional regulator n=1 Tax=Clostridium sp. 19966 TaxID=2768166 RepID=UPI0028DF1B55|nr:AraC family transcriptional regulator [Clostridium sp. 19966]MDT8715670.1 helix-turn-helix transcriptional regulator [Clostridium sp. 19966]
MGMIFPLITDFEQKLPLFLAGVGCKHSQENVYRPNGYPYLQWIQCRKGTGKLIVDGYTYNVNENQGFLLFPNIAHEYYSTSEHWEVDWLTIGGYLSSEMFKKAGMDKSQVFYVSEPELILLRTEKMLDICTSYNTLKSLDCSKILYSLIIDIIAYASKDKSDFIVGHYSKLKNIFDYIDSHFNKVITLEELSSIADITPQYLCALFKKTTGMRIFEYINSIRIKNSKEMILKQRDMSIKNISLNCGYDDVSYFCSIFKRLEKVTPGEFKKLHGV